MSDQKVKFNLIESREEDPMTIIPARSVTVATFNPAPEVTARPAEVHVYVTVEGLDEPVAAMFTNPPQLAAFIRELTNAGKAVWVPVENRPAVFKVGPTA